MHIMPDVHAQKTFTIPEKNKNHRLNIKHKTLIIITFKQQ